MMQIIEKKYLAKVQKKGDTQNLTETIGSISKKYNKINDFNQKLLNRNFKGAFEMIDSKRKNNRDSLVDKMKAMNSVEKNRASVHELNLQEEMRSSLNKDEV